MFVSSDSRMWLTAIAESDIYLNRQRARIRTCVNQSTLKQLPNAHRLFSVVAQCGTSALFAKLALQISAAARSYVESLVVECQECFTA